MTVSSQAFLELHREEIVGMVRTARDTEVPQTLWLEVRDGTVFLTTGPNVSDPAATYLISWVGPWDSRGTIEVNVRGFEFETSTRG